GFEAGDLFQNALMRGLLAGKVEYGEETAISTIEAYVKAAESALETTVVETGLTGSAKEALARFATDKVSAAMVFLRRAHTKRRASTISAKHRQAEKTTSSLSKR